MEDIGINDFIHFLKKKYRVKKINADTLIEDDLGITGLDGDGLLEDIEKEFNVRFPENEDEFRALFDLEKDEYLFHSEGSWGWAFMKKLFPNNEKVVKLSVGQLYNAVVTLL